MRRRTAIFTTLLGALALMSWPAAGLGQQSTSATAPHRLSFRLALKRLEPATVTVPAGRYQIILVNGLVVNAVVPFRLDVKNGAMLAQAQVAKGATKAKFDVTLAPGTYILEAGGRPEWRSEIIVTEPKAQK